MYHDVGEATADGYTVSRRKLEADLALVGAPGGAISCAVTFDDGRAGTFVHALPALLESQIPATLFAISGFLGRPGFMEPWMLRVWHAAGLRVGSHSVTHRPLPSLSQRDARRELSDSKARLEDILGAPVADFALPGGNDTRRVRQLALESGYARVYTSRPAFAREGDRALPRFAIRETTPVDAIRLLRAGRVPESFRADRLRFAAKRALGLRLYLMLRSRLRPEARGAAG